MSYRYISGPDRALATRLTDVQSNLRQVEKRVRWTGAHIMAEELDEIPLPIYPEFDSFVYTPVISVTVGEGRWVLLSTTTLSVTQVRAPFYPGYYYPRARIQKVAPIDIYPLGVTVAKAVTMFLFNWQFAGAYAARCLPLSTATFEVSETTTFELQVQVEQTEDHLSPPSPSTVAAKMSRLQAVPL